MPDIPPDEALNDPRFDYPENIKAYFQSPWETPVVMPDMETQSHAEFEALYAEIARLRDALEALDGDCYYEIEERRCCSEQYVLPYDDWCIKCIAHAALLGLPHA